MTATTAPIAHGDDHAHGGGHHHTSLGLDNRKIAIWTFIGSECMLFASLISTYLIYKGRSPTGPFPHEPWTNPSTGEVMKPILDIPVTSASAFVLLMSSVAMVMALNAVQTKYEPKVTTWDKIKGSSKLWLAATALLGTIFLGIACWVARYFALGYSADGGAAQTALIFTAILLHGACYDFLFIAGQLYVDEEANERIRGAAQGLIAFILWGVGAFVGTLLAGQVLAQHALKTPTAAGIAHDWKAIWLTPAWGALAVLVLFVLFFRNPGRKADAGPAS